MRELNVNPASSGTSYRVIVGRDVTRLLADILPDGRRRLALVADERVAELHAEPVLAALRAAGREPSLVTFPPGEASKSRDTKASVEDRMLASGIGRDGAVVALGGGVTINLAGFVAATYMRGVPWVALPTTMLAMLDSGIGGKTGVDVPAGKNLVGAFHRPAAVLCDTARLDTLPDVQLRAGLAEAVKHGLVASAEHTEDLEVHADEILARREEVLERIVADSAAIKIRFVEEDEMESGARKALNFGHTFAHALERLAGWSIPHGEAVARGLVFESRLSVDHGGLGEDRIEHVRRVLRRLDLPDAPFDGLPPELVPEPAGHLCPQAFIEATRSDKKTQSGRVEYVLLQEIGQVIDGWTRAVDEAAVAATLAATAARRVPGQ